MVLWCPLGYKERSRPVQKFDVWWFARGPCWSSSPRSNICDRSRYCDRCSLSLSLSLSKVFSFFSSLGLASQQQRLPHFWLSMSSKLFYLCVCARARGDLEYWVHVHVLCVLLGFGEDLYVCVCDVNVRWNCFEFHYGDDLYFLIACDRFRMNSPSITWAEVASTALIFVCTCPLSSERSLRGFFWFIYLFATMREG